MRRFLAFVFAPAVNHRKALLAMNLVYWGAMLLGMAATLIDRTLQPALTQAVVEGFSPGGSLGPLVRAYSEGQLASAIVLTFAVNLLMGSLLVITLLSLILPFGGLLMGVVRASMWGMLFSPFGAPLDPAFLLQVSPHALTVLIEGEAYVVAMLGVWLWWSSVARSSGKRWQAWRQGASLQARVYLGVGALLAVAAIWEAFEVIYLISQ